MKIKIFVLLLVVVKIGFGQIEITTLLEVTPEEMVENIVGKGIQYFNVQYTGADQASGIFTNGSSTNLGMESGIFLTTGAGYVIPGPNDNCGATVDNGTPGDPTLDSISTLSTYNAAVIQFDFIPIDDTVMLRYVYGSEEYNITFAVDVCGFFIYGPDPQGGFYINKNIAKIPGTNINVNNYTINNGVSGCNVKPTGPCNYCQYYLDNNYGVTLQYDGFTTLFTSILAVVPCEQYHIKIAIADGRDPIFDSGIFLEEGSFTSPAPEVTISEQLDPPGLTENMVEGHVEADLVFNLPSAEYAPVTICYEISGTAINGIDYEEIDNCITFEEGEDSAVIHVVPLQDGVIEGDETIVLIIENTLGCEVLEDTIELIIKDYVELYSTDSPNTLICSGAEVELWVDVINGFLPYTYNWEPGSFTNATIVVSPEETTTYTVTYSDIFGETDMDSIEVTVFNGNSNNIIAFSFLVENNPFLSENVFGTILEDSVLLILPPGQSAENLVAAISLPTCARVFVDGEEQLSGVSVNDFTNPVTYQVMAANGELHDWLVVVEIETGMTDEIADGMTLFPNPSTGKLYLNINNSNHELIELVVMNLTGRIVYEKKQTLAETIEIDLSSQQQGMYFLRVKAGEMVVNRKLIHW